MANNVDTELTEFIVNDVESDELAKELAESGLLEDGQFVVTPEEDKNLSYLRTEIIYDITSSDSSKNWGYTSGIKGGTTVSGKNFSKYKALITISREFDQVVVTILPLDVSTRQSNYLSASLDLAKDAPGERYYCLVTVNSDKTSISFNYGYQSGSSYTSKDSADAYHCRKIIGVLV